MRLLIAIGIAVHAYAACVPVITDHISAGDLAKAVPELSVIPASAVFGFAPQPGLTRTISAAQIRRFAESHGSKIGEGREVCVVYPVRVLVSSDVIEALRAAVGSGEAEIEILELSRAGVPAGRLVFPTAGAARPDGDGAVLWRGYVQYGNRRRASVWARVRVWTTAPETAAAKDLRPGQRIQSGDILVLHGRRPWSGGAPMPRDLHMAGRVLARAVRAGEVIRPEWLASAAAVSPGDEVAVQVRSGTAVLAFSAKALSAASLGSPVSLVNPMTGKRFRALVSGERAAVLDVGKGGK